MHTHASKQCMSTLLEGKLRGAQLPLALGRLKVQAAFDHKLINEKPPRQTRLRDWSDIAGETSDVKHEYRRP